MPLKLLTSFWRVRDNSLINCEVSLILTWSENCVITSKATRYVDLDTNPVVAAVMLCILYFDLACNSPI